jgi:predicted amidophosphoribosyltransferase
MEKNCPTHGTPLEARGRLWHCQACQADYRLRGLCGQCGAELERLAACGASNWFCNHCNELKSRSSIRTELVRVEPA